MKDFIGSIQNEKTIAFFCLVEIIRFFIMSWQLHPQCIVNAALVCICIRAIRLSYKRTEATKRELRLINEQLQRL